MENTRTPEQQQQDAISAILLARFEESGMTYAALMSATHLGKSTIRRIFNADREIRDMRYVDFVKVSKALGKSFGEIVAAAEAQVEEARGGQPA